jgi:hypothetical protein
MFVKKAPSGRLLGVDMVKSIPSCRPKNKKKANTQCCYCDSSRKEKRNGDRKEGFLVKEPSEKHIDNEWGGLKKRREKEEGEKQQ